jgi:hypothetical protein
MRTITPAEKFTQSLTYIKHFIENAEMQINKMRLEKKTDPNIIEAKTRSLNLIVKFVWDTENYLKQLETRNQIKNHNRPPDQKQHSNDLLNFDKTDPGQREGLRYLSIQSTKEKWPELY